MKFIDRHISKQIQDAAKSFPAVVVAGPRQTGKTTLLRALFPQHRYVTLDRPMFAEQAEKDPEAFLAQNPPPLLIDEVQYAPALFRHLKIMIDETRDKKGQFILTGSQKFTLMQGVSESLAGRIAIFDFEGLSALEVLDAHLADTNLDGILRMIMRGGFPELWDGQDRKTQLYLDSYIATYLERDVKQILSVGNLRDFERFLRGCALRTGQQLNKSDLARDIGVSVTTVGEWLSVLQALGQVVLLEPWFGNLNKRIVKAPKLFFSDTALACRLCGIPENQLMDSPMIGAIWETFVFSELRKQLAFAGHPGNLWYYRDQSQTEVDFVLEEGHRLTLYECKWTSNPKSETFKNFARMRKAFESSKTHWQIVSTKIVSRASQLVQAENVTYCSPFIGLLD